jgi:fucose permease
VKRSTATLTLYAAFGCLGYVLTGLGAILPELRDDLGLSRVEVALYPSAFALGLIVVGVAGHHAAEALGDRAVPVALAGLGVGALLLASGVDRALSGAGALLLGLGCAGLVQFVPAALRAEHGDRAAVAIGEANAVSSGSAVLAPLLVGAALAVGAGWRVGYLALPLAGVAILLTRLLRAPGGPPSPAEAPAGVASASLAPGAASPGGGVPRAFLDRWFDLVLVVSVEFCLVFWAVDFMRTERGLVPDVAAASAALLTLGMAVGRAATGPITRAVPVAPRLLAADALAAAAGFALLWAVDQPVVASAGLLLAGLGISLLYPVTLAEALAAWPGAPDRAAARCALASGLAIGAAPLLLGALADALGLRVAILLTPALLAAFLTRCAARLAAERRVPGDPRRADA